MITVEMLAALLHEELTAEGLDEIQLDWLEALSGTMDTDDANLMFEDEPEIEDLKAVLERVVARIEDQ